ncbi:DUF1223 domain-containing protein [Falsigemmobacter intermedius]|uniref:DUF1223 domain-containing protein n=1 Tax=Falsigemmobacter intermedius TaxID=1553448 RepID=A0A444MCP6_9RHOB|nr:DUF1223 domain-containing protein [Falsigemmobacter intermedius]RWY41778.1 DUF1223 domain-containing protein [Falsigemmobacter intermedius]
MSLFSVTAVAAQDGLPDTVPKAAQMPVLVELFTSQGCISCPPADEVFSRLADEPGVIALALHVDYWDYLGWEDAFADPAHTIRQKRYALSSGAKMIYTPQVILNGVERLQGAREAEIRTRIAELSRRPAAVGLKLRREAESLTIDVAAAAPLSRPAVLHLVRYHPGREVEIERGENAGQTITYRNVVTSWTRLAEWRGEAPISLRLPLEGEDRLVVIVQEQGPGQVLAAEQLD